MIFRKPIVLIAGVLLLAAATATAQGGSPYNFIRPVISTFDADAGIPVQIPLFIENQGAAAVTLEIAISGAPEYSLDSLSQVIHIQPNMIDVGLVHFLAMSAGTYTALLTVTDGTLTDSLVLTGRVSPPAGPFFLLPPYHDLISDIGTQLKIPVTIRNATPNAYSVTVGLSGDSEFSYSGAQTVSLAANGEETIYIDFFSTTEGFFSSNLTVTDGSYSMTALMNVQAVDRIYNWIVPFEDEFITMEGEQQTLPIFLENTSGTPVTLSINLTGDNAFDLDPAYSQLTLVQSATVPISFLSQIAGTFTALLTVTDGSAVDSLLITVHVQPGPGDFVITPEHYEFRVQEQTPFTCEFTVLNMSSSTQNLTLSLSGDPQFSMQQNNPISLAPRDAYTTQVQFQGATEGWYSATLTATNGVETDSAMIIAHVGDTHVPGTLYTLQYDGKDFFFPFEAAAGASVTKDLIITNVSGQQLVVDLSLRSDSSFSLSASTVTIDSASSATVQVTFDNSYGGIGEGFLILEGGSQVEHLFLAGFTTPWKDFNGLLVMNELDFGMVDTSMQVCLDVVLENTTQNSIPISNIQLSGFSSDFTLPNTSNFSINPGETKGITVCFKPSVVSMVMNEVLTFSFTNPASNPNTQTASVNLTGRGGRGIGTKFDSCGIVGWYVNTISAPIDGSTDASIELYNISNQSITLDNAYWEDGNQDGIYSLLTQLPITIQPHNPTVPSSGKQVVQIRYAPTAQSSTPGVEDVATLRLEASASQYPTQFWLTLVGIPTNPAPAGGTIVLFPKDGNVPTVDLRSAANNGIQELQFRNNLDVAVTISGYELASDERFEIVDQLDAPTKLQSGETIAVKLRTKRVPLNTSTDALIMHGSHEHLHSRFQLLSGSATTAIDGQPASVENFACTLSPNPARNTVAITLNQALTTGRVQVIDNLGRLVTEFDAQGNALRWDGNTSSGVPAGAGIYHLRISGTTTNGLMVSDTHRLVKTQ